MRFKEVIREDLLEISPYRLDEDFPTEALPDLVRMSLNENPLIEKGVLTKMLGAALRRIDPRDYPEPHARLAVEAIRKFYNIEASRIFVGNGLDDVLDRLTRTIIDNGSRVVVAEPTFFMYTYYTQLCRGQKVEVMLKPDFSLDIDALIKASREARLLFICSPNSPTGNQFEERDLKELLGKCPTTIVIDETYAEFAGYSVLKWADQYDNLVVLRTFSKAYGLAGVRIGYLIADQQLVDGIKKTVHPFNVSSVAQQLVVEALRRFAYFKKRWEAVKKEREWLKDQLQQLRGVTPFPSDTNFILFRVEGTKLSSQIQSELRQKGVLIKDRGSIPMLRNCLRVTVGTRSLNERFLRELRRILI
jgi:histidinol-phosphate aminotransferase